MFSLLCVITGINDHCFIINIVTVSLSTVQTNNVDRKIYVSKICLISWHQTVIVLLKKFPFIVFIEYTQRLESTIIITLCQRVSELGMGKHL